MPIDPVILLVENIRSLEMELRAECKVNFACYSQDRMATIERMVAKIRSLYTDLLDAIPTSALGAGEQVRVAAYRLPFSHARYAAHLHNIADRLSAGERLQNDLIWLRALCEALAVELPDDKNAKTAALLAQAIQGIARPVVVYRAVTVQGVRATFAMRDSGPPVIVYRAAEPRATRPPYPLRGLADGPHVLAPAL